MGKKGTTFNVPFMLRLVCEATVDGEDENTILAMHVRYADVGTRADIHPDVRAFIDRRSTDLVAMAVNTAAQNAAESIVARAREEQADARRLVIPTKE